MRETKVNTPVAELVWNAKYRASGHGIRGASYDRYQEIFLHAWRLGLKGCTLFRPRHGEEGVFPIAASEVGNEKY